MLELLFVPEKACLATARRLPHPEQMTEIQQLWKLSTSGVPQRLYEACRCIVCLAANVICILSPA